MIGFIILILGLLMVLSDGHVRKRNVPVSRNYDIPIRKVKYNKFYSNKKSKKLNINTEILSAEYQSIKIPKKFEHIPPANYETPILPHQKQNVELVRVITPKLKTLVIGLGGLGGHAVTYLRKHSSYKFDTCAVDTNSKDLFSTESTFRILLGKNELKGLGTGIAPEISAKLARNALPELEAFIRQHAYEQIIAIAGGGGGTGSGALPVISQYAKQYSMLFIPCLTMPFDFEGNKKSAIANATMKSMQDIYPDTFVAHQQPMLKQYPEAKFKDALTETIFVIQQYIEKNLTDISANEKTTKIKSVVKKEVSNPLVKPVIKSIKSKTIHNDLSNILTKDELELITRHKLSINDFFDSRGMSKKDRDSYAEVYGKGYCIGITCKKDDCRLKTSSYHCIQCNRSAIAHKKRHYETGYVYIQGSISKKLIKIGVAKDITERNKSLNFNGYAYAGSDDWKILYSVWTENKGEIEHKAQQKLQLYQDAIPYNKGLKEQVAREVFRCSYSTAKAALDESLKGKSFKEEKLPVDNIDKYEF